MRLAANLLFYKGLLRGQRKRGFCMTNKDREINFNYVLEAKKSPCVDCNRSYAYYVMQFDHVDGTKYAGVSSMLRDGYSLELIKNEISKCELVCANCHAERTALRAGYSVKQRAPQVRNKTKSVATNTMFSKAYRKDKGIE